MTRLFRLAALATLGVYALIVVGGITGHLHRTAAAALGVLVVAVAVGTICRQPGGGVGRRTRVAAWTAVGLLAAQAALGAVAAWRELPAAFLTAHLGAALLCLGATVLTAYYLALDRGSPAWVVRAGLSPVAGEPGSDEPAALPDLTFLRIAQVGAVAVFVLILTGGATASTGASLACDSWPLCIDARIVPDRTSDETWINLAHRAIAVVGAVLLAGVAYAAHRRRAAPEARWLALAACAVFAAEVLVGAVYVWSGGAAWIGATHLAAAAAIWGLMLGVAIVAGRAWESVVVLPSLAGGESLDDRGARPAMVRAPAGPSNTPRVGGVHASSARSEPALTWAAGGAVALAPAVGPTPFVLVWPDLRRVRAVVADYVALTKPGIMTLLLLTTFGAMLVAADGFPAFGLVLATLVGGVLAAGGANALNCYIDRDIDALMPRTRRRGTANGRIAPRDALIFGVGLSVLAVVELGLLVNWPAAALALAGNLFYVFVYTKWLKRATPQNIVIGGAAGAVPPLVGWAAVTGGLGWAPWLMFLTIFAWTPPHFWALALLKQGEYGRAAVPMLPVVAGERATRRQILVYTLALFPVTLALCLVGLGPIYLGAALVLNSVFLALAWRLWRTPSKRLARRTFFWSLWYLALLFAAMVADRLFLA
jgi:protoheme IX farnesyltransferase